MCAINLQAREIERNLHRILPGTNQDVQCQRDLIHEFALQVQHQPFLISPNGFFNLDLKLMGSVCIIQLD